MLLAVVLIAAAPAALEGTVNDAVQNAASAIRAPGLGVAVVDDGKVLLDRGYGFADVDRQVVATRETQFEIGSVTKQFTAAAILLLKEQGKLSLHDPLGKYVPEYPQGKNVTIEQLLWQVSGIPNYTDANHFVAIAGHSPGGLLPALALIKNKPLEFKPGTKWEYSNTNYLLLGGVVARVSHMPWETYVRKNIFARAGMTHSAFIDDEPSLSDMATGYHLDKQHHPVLAPPLHAAWAGSAGAIVSTAGDLAKWDLAFFGGKIVRPADVRLATTAHTLPSGHSTEYGFGWEVNTFEGQPRISHNGGTFGFLSVNEYFPKLRQFVIVLSNSDSAPPPVIGAAAFAALNPQIAAVQQKAVPGEHSNITALARQWIGRLQAGDIDRSQLTSKVSALLSVDMVRSLKSDIGGLGEPTSFVYRGMQSVNGIAVYKYRVQFPSVALLLTLAIDSQGKIAGLYLSPQ